MLLSLDWDYFSGCLEFVFDAPIWGSADTDFDRLEAWTRRAQKRGGDLSADFPLFGNWRKLLQFRGIPTFATLGHADAYALLEKLQISRVVNFDSHHDLFSQSGDPTRVRAGNWAGLALGAGLLEHYTCVYPPWHAQLPVAEGYDLSRTWTELGERFTPSQVCLERCGIEEVRFSNLEALLLVQSPAWTSPEHDSAFFELCEMLQAEILEPPLHR